MSIDVASIRKELGLTQQQLADKLGVARNTVNRWEHNQGKPGMLARRELDQLMKEK